MKKFLLIPALLISLASLTVSQGCTGNRTGEVDSFSEKIYEPKEAKGFEILGEPGKKSVLIRSKAPWQGAEESEVRELLILRGGESAPEEFKGQILKEEAKRVICMSSGHIAMLSKMEELDRIVGGSTLDYVADPKIQQKRNSLAEIGFEGNIDYEALVGADPDLVILYGVNSSNPMEAKLRELGIPFIYIGDYLEQSPLGKAEWMVAIGECIGRREKSIKLFNPIAQRYNNLKRRLETLPADSEHPKVMLNTPYGDQWLMPPTGSYMVRLIKDAGGEYLYSELKGNSSAPISKETALQLTGEADLWLNVGNDINNMSDLRKALPLFTEEKVVKNGEIYTNLRRQLPSGGNDFYESGIVNPDIILRDLIKIFYPQLVDEDLYYYRKLE